MPGPVPHLAMSAKPETLEDNGHPRSIPPGTELGGLDAQLWHACAGGMVQLPRVGSRVVYFPQGHGEQASSPPDFPASMGPLGSVPCRVVSVNFLADGETDEVFSRICLQPEGGGSGAGEVVVGEEATVEATAPSKPAAFSKTLTQSDANNGGGFSVPRYCAETIFPPLDYATDPPVQTVLAKDVHGDVWKFRHIYRGTPRRHLLTTGWSTFVNHKKLVAGDAIVFLRIASGELCVGVRRSMRGANSGESCSSWHSSLTAPSAIRPSSFADFLGGGNDNTYRPSESQQTSPTSNNFARDRVRVTAKSVLEAAQLAVAGKQFEVVYYPRASTAEFCVEAGLVKSALEHSWYAGMRFKMAFETEDSSRISWFMGTIAAVQPTDPVLWPNSPWRVLQVAWDEPDLLQGVSRVSPWQVKLLATLPMQLPPFSLPKKKLRASLPQELQLQAPGLLAGLPPLSAPGSSSNAYPAHVPPPPPPSWQGSSNNPAALSDDSSAGIQGARHDHYNGLNPSTDFRTSNYKRPRESHPLYHHHQEAMTTAMMMTPPHQVFHPRAVLSEPPVAVAVAASALAASSNSNSSSSSSSYFSPLIAHPHAHHRRPDLSAVPSMQPLAFMSASVSAQLEPPAKKTTTAATSFFLFGQCIDPSCASKSQPGRASNDNNVLFASKDTARNSSSESEDKDRAGPHGGRHHMDMVKWLQTRGLDGEGPRTAAASPHLKVSVEGEEVARSLELSWFSTYNELQSRLAAMFSVAQSQLQDCVVYRDARGVFRRIGDEPFRSFVETVRHVTILQQGTDRN